MKRHEISEEQMEINSEVFSRLKKGALVRIECYYAFHDVTFTGTVTTIDTVFQYLKLGKDKFPFPRQLLLPAVKRFAVASSLRA